MRDTQSNDCDNVLITWMLYESLGIKTDLYKHFEAMQDGKTNEEWAEIFRAATPPTEETP
jgi:hypothetical protein